MSIAFDALGSSICMVSLTAVELSIVMGVGPGWGCPISSRAVHKRMASLQP